MRAYRFFETGIVAALALLSAAAGAVMEQHKAASLPAGDTETVISTFRVKAGMEEEFAKLLAEVWPTYRRLGMVLDKPHILLRGIDESGKTYFVEILTWKSPEEPDNAPPEVRELWRKLEAMCEPRLGHRGIEFPEMKVVAME